MLKYAGQCYSIIEELDKYDIRFQKNENGDFAVKKVHHMCTYVLPMPNSDTVKKAIYRQLRRVQLLISNRFIATRLLLGKDGRVAGAIAVNTRTAEFLVIKAIAGKNAISSANQEAGAIASIAESVAPAVRVGKVVGVCAAITPRRPQHDLHTGEPMCHSLDVWYRS